jgi:hypothetical protein
MVNMTKTTNALDRAEEVIRLLSAEYCSLVRSGHYAAADRVRAELYALLDSFGRKR